MTLEDAGEGLRLSRTYRRAMQILEALNEAEPGAHASLELHEPDDEDCGDIIGLPLELPVADARDVLSRIMNLCLNRFRELGFDVAELGRDPSLQPKPEAA